MKELSPSAFVRILCFYLMVFAEKSNPGHLDNGHLANGHLANVKCHWG